MSIVTRLSAAVAAAIVSSALAACGGAGAAPNPGPAPSLTPTPSTTTSGSQTQLLFSCFGDCANGTGNTNTVTQTVAVSKPPTSAASAITATIAAQLQGANSCTNTTAQVSIAPPAGGGLPVSAGSTIGTPSTELDTGAKTFSVTYASPSAIAGTYTLSYVVFCGPGNGSARALLNWAYSLGA